MLRTMLYKQKNIDIQNYTSLKSFIKSKNIGVRVKKAKIFDDTEIKNFIENAPDSKYLAIKVCIHHLVNTQQLIFRYVNTLVCLQVATILGITGALRRDELYKLKINNMERHGSVLLFHILDTKNHKDRTFTVEGHYCQIIEKYIQLRPDNVEIKIFFLKYCNDKCSKQVIGINTIGSMPTNVAQWLNLPNPKEYTGHSFRRTSATILSNAGADTETLQKHGGWSSSKTAEGYVEQSINNKRKISTKIIDSIEKSGEEVPSKKSKIAINSSPSDPINANKNNTITLNINVNTN